MKKFSLKALGATVLAASVVFFGIAGPANAIGPTPMTVTTTVSDFTAGAATGVFSVTGTQIQSSASMQMITLSIKDTTPTGWLFKTGCPASFNTDLSLCGVTGISAAIDGVNYSSIATGAQVKSMTYAPNGMYTITIQLGSAVSSVAGSKFKVELNNAFTAGPVGAYTLTYGVSPMSGTPENGTVTVNSVTSVTPATPTSASATLALSATTGDLVAGSTVSVQATGLEAAAAYTVVVESTPQTIGSGNATAGAVNTSVTLPSGLEAGWHTLTFTSTASDGSAVTSVSYFKVSASGTLLATSSTIPAELAQTGFDGKPYLYISFALAIAGAALMLLSSRRKQNI